MFNKPGIWLFLILILTLSYVAASSQEQLTQEDIILLQQTLKDSGYDVGIVDGIMGNKTRDAIKQYQNDKGLPVTGEVTDETLKSLFPPPEEVDDNSASSSVDEQLKRTVIAAGLAVLIALIVIVTQKKSFDEKYYDKIINKADIALKAGKLNKAKKYYENLIKTLK